MEQKTQRQTAFKIRIGDIARGKQILEGDRLTFLELSGKQVIRVNLVANIIDKYVSEGEKKYLALTIDDASGQIKIKTFGEDVDKFKEIGQGDTVMIIGVLRLFNNELYVLPEVIKTLDPRYLLVRKLELEKEIPKEIPKEERLAIKDQIINMIKSSEESGGIDVDEIILKLNSSPDAINQEVQKLLEEGLAYEPRPGKVRYLG